MSYEKILEGKLTGKNPPGSGSAPTTDGGLRISYELRYYKEKEKPTYQNRTYTCPAGTFWLYYRLGGWLGRDHGSAIRLSSSSNDESGYVRLLNDGTRMWEMNGQSVSYMVRNPRFVNSSDSGITAYTWYKVSDAPDSNYRVYPEGLKAVEKGSTLKLRLVYSNIKLIPTSGAQDYNTVVISANSGNAVVIEVPISYGATIQVMQNGIWVPHEINIRESGEWKPYSANIRKGSEWVPYS